jgi:RNA polymerase sigma-70 factor, ECF subfamily
MMCWSAVSRLAQVDRSTHGEMSAGTTEQLPTEEAALAAAFALRLGPPAEREQCVLLLNRALGKRLERYFVRHRVAEAEAEELVWEVWLRVLQGNYRGDARPVIWIWTIARNLMLDHHRARRPEVQCDDEGWDALLGRLPAPGIAAWVRLCIQRALAQFELDHPERAEVLRMVAEEWSAQEIGAVFGCSAGAARDRSFRARELARGYLAECQEAT